MVRDFAVDGQLECMDVNDDDSATTLSAKGSLGASTFSAKGSLGASTSSGRDESNATTATEETKEETQEESNTHKGGDEPGARTRQFQFDLSKPLGMDYGDDCTINQILNIVIAFRCFMFAGSKSFFQFRITLCKLFNIWAIIIPKFLWVVIWPIKLFIIICHILGL